MQIILILLLHANNLIKNRYIYITICFALRRDLASYIFYYFFLLDPTQHNTTQHKTTQGVGE
jgi:hypothetical protein